ncbi:MAG: D-aminoacylase [Thermoleophilia bacterium]|nr:D-aminoacylase [Thermoleophilia bacterium]
MTADLVLTGGLLADGTGAPVRLADIAITGDRVTAVVGPGGLAATPARERLDITGLVVAPGFVDLHGHSDTTVLSDGRAISKVHQGITTEVSGNCGMSPAPAPPERRGAVRRAIGIIDLDPGVDWRWSTFAEYRARVDGAVALNLAPLVGHVALRVAVNGDDPGLLDAAGRARLEAAADEALSDGAIGISTGLMYPPAMFADPAELAVLGRVARRHDALFAVHMRNYGDALLPAVDEALAVARETGCRLQVSHLAVAGRRNWGSVRTAIARIDAARADGLDVAADIYPYLAGSANLSQLLPVWAQEGGSVGIAERLADPSVRARIRAEWTTTLHLGWDEVYVSLVDDDLRELVLGRSIVDAAAALDLPPDEAALELMRRTEDRVQMVAFGRSPDDLLAVLAHPATAIGSDGLALDPDGPTGVGRPHPRSYGCYPCLLGRLVREDGTLTLERAIAMSTSIPAARARLRDRGVLREGAFADVTVLDATTVIDRNSFEDPTRRPEGIVHVIVNGRAVVRDGVQDPAARPGRALTAG